MGTAVFFEIVLWNLAVDRDDVEEGLEDVFGADGEITGAGTGMGRCHLDLEVVPELDRDEALERIRGVLDALEIEEWKINVSD